MKILKRTTKQLQKLIVPLIVEMVVELIVFLIHEGIVFLKKFLSRFTSGRQKTVGEDVPVPPESSAEVYPRQEVGTGFQTCPEEKGKE